MADEKDPKAEGIVSAKAERIASAKEERVVEARLKLRERFLEKMKSTPAASDSAPQGSGPLNRHGMPRLPTGQTLTKGWPEVGSVGATSAADSSAQINASRVCAGSLIASTQRRAAA